MELKSVDISGTSMPYDSSTNQKRHDAAIQYATNTLIPALESIPNISYVGEYHTENKPLENKYMFEVGYNDYYLCVMQNTAGFRFALSKKTENESLSCIITVVDNFPSEEVQIKDVYQMVYTGVIDYIIDDNNTLLAIYNPSISGEYWFFDTDNYNRKYIVCGTGSQPKYTYDNGLYITQQINNYVTQNNNITDTVYIENVSLVQSGALMGISNHLKRIWGSVSGGSTGGGTSRKTLIDVDGIRYRQLRGIYWVIES